MYIKISTQNNDWNNLYTNPPIVCIQLHTLKPIFNVHSWGYESKINVSPFSLVASLATTYLVLKIMPFWYAPLPPMMVCTMYLITHASHHSYAPKFLCAPIFMIFRISIGKKWIFKKNKPLSKLDWKPSTLFCGMVPNQPRIYNNMLVDIGSCYWWMIKINLNFLTYHNSFVQSTFPKLWLNWFWGMFIFFSSIILAFEMEDVKKK
jgi:hypothetical protein